MKSILISVLKRTQYLNKALPVTNQFSYITTIKDTLYSYSRDPTLRQITPGPFLMQVSSDKPRRDGVDGAGSSCSCHVVRPCVSH